MGMTIDEAIDFLVESKYSYESPSSDTLDVAINTMRKYQKIKEILNSAGYIKNGTVYSYTYDEDSRVKHIREVFEDGSENNHHAHNT